MTQNIELSSAIFITVNGQSMQEVEGTSLLEVVIDQHAHLPSMFNMRFFDPDFTMLDSKRLTAGQVIEISSKTIDGKLVKLIKGEVTSVEPVFEQDGARLIVRGYDPSYHLYRVVRSRTFVNIKDSDLAEKIAQEWNLKPIIEPTKQVYEHIFQRNQNDLAFLLQRAWRIGYECFVADDKLYFRKPQPTTTTAVTLKLGFDLLNFRPRMSNAEQVNEIIIRSWDVAKQKPIIGRSQNGALFAKTKDAPKSHFEEVKFGEGKLIVVDYPVKNQTEADTLANARMNELSGVFVSGEGTAFRRPEITAGGIVKLEGLGKRFSGRFLVTSARHVFTASSGFETRFLINGTRSGLLVDEMMSFDNLDRWYGVVTAVVTNNKDPKNLGRVKVKYPWLDTRVESDWVAVTAPGAGSNSGFFSLPSVEDQVLISFEHGDFSRPMILGSVPREEYKVDDVTEHGKTAVHTWRSASGHEIRIEDSSTKKAIMLKTTKGHCIKLDDTGEKLTIKTVGGSEITIDDQSGKVTVKSEGDLALDSQGNINVEAQGNLNLKAGGRVKVEGTRIDLN